MPRAKKTSTKKVAEEQPIAAPATIEVKSEVSTAAEERMERLETQLAEIRDYYGHTGDDAESGVTQLIDPYENHNAFKVLGDIEPCTEYPDGAKVAWKNPEYRKRRGWRGWDVFEWGDKFTGEKGELLTNYIPDPPEHMLAHKDIDQAVRRGDVVLARLPMNLWEARQQKRLSKSRSKQAAATDPRSTTLQDGVVLTGPGATRDRR